jgi:hypothetical protein
MYLLYGEAVQKVHDEESVVTKKAWCTQERTVLGATARARIDFELGRSVFDSAGEPTGHLTNHKWDIRYENDGAAVLVDTRKKGDTVNPPLVVIIMPTSIAG